MVQKLLFILLVVILVYAYFFGPLLPLNSDKPGYEKLETPMAIVYIKDSNQRESIYDDIDSLLIEAQDMYGLKFKNKVQVLIAIEPGELGPYIPWLPHRELTSASTRLGNMVYLNVPKIHQHGYKEEEFLKYEIIRNLLTQNTNFFNEYTMNTQHWMAEGMSGHFGGPHYYSEIVFADLITGRALEYSTDSPDIYSNLDPKDEQFNSTLYRLFVTYMINTHGRDTFNSYVQQYLDTPDRYRALYVSVFGVSLLEDLHLFEQSVKN